MKEKRLKGAIKYWNGRKGFGFIIPENDDKQIFVHIKAFTERKGKPIIGQEVTYTLSADDQGRPRAENVMNAADDVASESSSIMMIAAVAVVVIVAVAVYLWV
ncbi:MAG: cold shock domain-containing protein [Methylophagaceae bacterium]